MTGLEGMQNVFLLLNDVQNFLGLADKCRFLQTQIISLGISPCPNDTFAFHVLLTRQVDWRGLDFEVELLDIEQLNERLLRDELDVCKVSFHAALAAADDLVVLPSGSALGFGVGPLLLAATAGTRPANPQQLTLCPGRHTTAALLFALFHPH